MKPIINYLRRQQVTHGVFASTVGFIATAAAVLFTGAITIASVAAVANAAEHEELGDIVARLQFDYFAADARALRRDLQALKQLEVPEAGATLRHYYLAYGNMKLAELLAENDKSTAKKAASECKEQAESVSGDTKRLNARERVRIETLSAELAAIHASCDGSAKALEKAASLAANNPRVQLLFVIEKVKHAKLPAEFADAHARLIAVAELFDTRATQLSQPELDMPDWGQAEALAWLGQSHMQQSNKVAARNTLERALVLAPDYAWARALQAQLRKER